MKTILLPKPLYDEWLANQIDKHKPAPKVVCTLSLEIRNQKGKLLQDYYEFFWNNIMYSVQLTPSNNHFLLRKL